jgi:hypothetical protein
MSDVSKAITAKVRQVLLGYWDPIGVQDLPEKYRQAATDEYDSYIGAVVGMLTAHRSQQEIADFLYDTEIRDMGGRRGRAPAETAAAALVDLRALATSEK